ncbi:phosphonate C-P lyase system protein PhnH [Viridibacterium curvum]|uniref:Phosphonate C-P lyase system protein PhnH n=1 Tax=Viridibacterium curvum TaxID=1101404 RepID=A0ABP9Q5Z0_9RHOO
MNTVTELDLAHMQPGFAEPVHEAQAAFRCVLDALSQPGRVRVMPAAITPPAGLSVARAAMLLALADYDTPVWLAPALRDGAAGHYLRFHCGCPLTAGLSDAHFVVLDGLAALPDLDTLRLGDPAYPDRSATLLIEVSELAEGGPITLRGPGIESTRSISVAGWTAQTTAFVQQNRAGFPLGVDIVFSCGDRIMGLPRTSIVEI